MHERHMIEKWESKYITARGIYEGRQLRGDMRFDKSTQRHPSHRIDPAQYIRSLRDSYHQFMRQNAERSRAINDAYARECTEVNDAGYMLPDQQPAALGAAPLTVGRYGDRAVGLSRGFDTHGVRLDAHHTPHDSMTSLPRADGTAVAIPEDLHMALHRERDGQRRDEGSRDNVTKDFRWLLPHLTKRGYSPQEILDAREKAHARNHGLDLYS